MRRIISKLRWFPYQWWVSSSASSFTFLRLSSCMMTAKRSRNTLQSQQKSALAKMVARNLLFMDFSAEMLLRNLSFALAKENFSCLSWQASKCLFLGSSRMNLKAFRMQYFTSSSLVFLRAVKRGTRVWTTWHLRHFGKCKLSSLGRDAPKCEFSTRKAIMVLLRTTGTQALSLMVVTRYPPALHCCLTLDYGCDFGREC